MMLASQQVSQVSQALVESFVGQPLEFTWKSGQSLQITLKTRVTRFIHIPGLKMENNMNRRVNFWSA